MPTRPAPRRPALALSLLAAASVAALGARPASAADMTEPPASAPAGDVPAVPPDGAPVASAPVVSAPVVSAPVVSAPVAPAPVAAPVVPAPVAAPVAPMPVAGPVAPMPVAVTTAKRPSFGHHGEVVVSQGFGFIGRSGDTTTIFLSPAFDFFVANGFSLGFAVSLERTITSTKTGSGESAKSSTTSSGSYGSELHIGFNVNFSSAVSMWPFLTSGIVADGGGIETWVGSYNMPLLVHPAAHFFVGLGPQLLAERSLKGSSTSTTWSENFTSFIGGWW